jgi:hypothetical protein
MIKVGFSNSKTLISRVICWLTNSKVSHTFLILEQPNGWPIKVPIVMEAAWDGFRMISLEQFQKTNNIPYIIEPVVPLDKGVEAAEHWLGEPYAYYTLIGMLWVLLGRFLRRTWRNPFNNPKSLMCSEAVVVVLQESGYPGADKLDPASVSPGDLLRFFQPNL